LKKITAVVVFTPGKTVRLGRSQNNQLSAPYLVMPLPWAFTLLKISSKFLWKLATLATKCFKNRNYKIKIILFLK